MTNRNLRLCSAYSTIQKRLIKEEINSKKNKIKQYSLEFNSVKKQLQSKSSFFPIFSHVCTLFKKITNKNLSKAKSIQNKNLSNLVFENSNLISKMPYEPEKVVFNFSSHELNDDKKPLLCKALNFPIPPKRFHYADHMLPFELLFIDIIKNSQ